MGLDRLAKILSGLARDLQRTSSTDEVMNLVTDSAVLLIPGAESASISIIRRHHSVISKAGTSEGATFFDDVQGVAKQGPCWNALFEHETVRADDLALDKRWPALGSLVSATHIRSAVCFQLYVEDDTLGSLNVLSSKPRAFDDASEHIGLLLASHAAVALAHNRARSPTPVLERDQVVHARAVGVIMERHRVSADEAAIVMKGWSGNTGQTLVEVAHDIVASVTSRFRSVDE